MYTVAELHRGLGAWQQRMYTGNYIVAWANHGPQNFPKIKIASLYLHKIFT
jgi:hypothetical protein